jgi:hypothetical protein
MCQRWIPLRPPCQRRRRPRDPAGTLPLQVTERHLGVGTGMRCCSVTDRDANTERWLRCLRSSLRLQGRWTFDKTRPHVCRMRMSVCAAGERALSHWRLD